MPRNVSCNQITCSKPSKTPSNLLSQQALLVPSFLIPLFLYCRSRISFFPHVFRRISAVPSSRAMESQPSTHTLARLRCLHRSGFCVLAVFLCNSGASGV
eukprot:TRINITY_DN2172_c0_g1_i1.p1 TRINITY_DN2172_c0_g1~~TRINITY_DN2172_c0_g1_i1.p1  ORF type:complete len:100 (+),score=10.44 TRINITY_DN2172_c0_g1_i1:479-778(+)